MRLEVCRLGDEKGVLLRIEIGPNKLEKNEVRILKCYTVVKMDVVTMDLVKKVKCLMEEWI